MATMNTHGEPLAVRPASHMGEEIERVLIGGNLANLTPDQRIQFYHAVCESVGLNPLTRPFEYITLNGKLTLYARRECTDQLRKLHGVSIKIAGRELIGDAYVVTAQATDQKGRTDESTGVLPIANLKGEPLANAMMKAETKAKRRVTLSLCGLGMMDESEVDGAIAEEQERERPAQTASEAAADIKTAPKPQPKEARTFKDHADWYEAVCAVAMQRGMAEDDIRALILAETGRQKVNVMQVGPFHSAFFGYLSNGAYDSVVTRMAQKRAGAGGTKKVVNEAEQADGARYEPIGIDDLFPGDQGRKL